MARRNPAENGNTLLVVLPVLLFIALIGTILIATVQRQSDAQSIYAEKIRAKYAAHSALQLALSEAIEAGRLTAPAKKGSKKAKARLWRDLPAQGQMAFGGGNEFNVMSYAWSPEDETLQFDRPLDRNRPPGSSIYILSDRDGDGAVMQITQKALGLMRLDSSPQALNGDNPSNPMLFNSSARSSLAGGELHSYVRFD